LGLGESVGGNLPVFGVDLAARFFHPPFGFDKQPNQQNRSQEGRKSQVCRCLSRDMVLGRKEEIIEGQRR